MARGILWQEEWRFKYRKMHLMGFGNVVFAVKNAISALRKLYFLSNRFLSRFYFVTLSSN